MPEDPADSLPPDPENEPPGSPAPLSNAEEADVGCLIFLGVAFVGVFLLPAAFLLGGAPLIVPVITCLLLALATPFLNPLEPRSPSVKWWGRVLTFLFLAGILVAVWLWLFGIGDREPESDFDEAQIGLPEGPVAA